MFKTTAAAFLSATAVMVGGASAHAQVTAEQVVLAETVTIDAEGREQVTTAPAQKVVPGDRLAYVLRYANEGDAPASDLVMVMPVPAKVALVPGSETGDAPEHSADGGATYGAPGTLTVTDADGERPAAPSDITHIRWRLAGNLAPGATGEVGYRATLR